MKKKVLALLLFLFNTNMVLVAETGNLPVPGFSHQEGFYADSFELQIACPDSFPDAWVTFNGSYPGPGNAESVLYTNPLLIDSREGDPDVFSVIPLNNGDAGIPNWLPPAAEVMKATIVGAVCVNDDNELSEQTFKTYFVGLDDILDFNVPIISIIAPPDSLFGHERGIMVPGVHYIEGQNRTGNYSQRGADWERMIHISFFEPDGQPAFGHFAGVRIHGNFSRTYPMKSVRIYSRSEYGKSRFDHKIFEDQPIQSFNRLILRNSGQDYNSVLMRDALSQRFFRNLPIETQDYRPSIKFVNGEFWGIYNIREFYDRHYFNRVHQIDRDSLDYLTFAFNPTPSANDGDAEFYVEMLDFIKENNMTDPDVYAVVETMMDVDNYINQLAINIYSSNNDWPNTNQRIFRTRNEYRPGHGVKDGRFRWLINDLDRSFGLFNPVTHNNFERVFQDIWYNEIFLALINNDQFRNDFINRIVDYMHSYVNPEWASSVISEVSSGIDSIIPYHVTRWQYPTSFQSWSNRVNSFKNWMINRPDVMRQQIVEQFELEGLAPFTIDISEPHAGLVKLNSILISPQTEGIPQNPYPFEAAYIAGIPVKLQAIPNAGYRFAGWIGYEGNASVIHIDPAMLHNITAVFEYEPFDGDEMNPVAHDLSIEDYNFDFWGPEQPMLTFPANMKFQQTATTDPGLDDEMTGIYFVPENDYHDDDVSSLGFPYALTRRTRINALGENGISFINTGRGRDVGAAVLALDLRNVEHAYVNFTAGTVVPNERVYAIRLQYRAGNQGVFNDLTMDNGAPIEYLRNEVSGHEVRFADIRLPEEVIGHPYVQLRWKYYHVEGSSGARAELRLDDIAIKTEALVSSVENMQAATFPEFELNQNYPNPFHVSTSIGFKLSERSEIVLDVFNMAGQRVATLANGIYDVGNHAVTFHPSMLPSGFYVYRLQVVTGNSTALQSRRMMVLP